jgi:hypothetical protein
VRFFVAVSVCLLGGCNALTGVGDLEEVTCTTDCVDDATTDSAIEQDTLVDSSPEDSGVRDTGPDAPADTFMPCKKDLDCDDKDDCSRDTCDTEAGTCSSAKIDEDMDGQSPSSLGACGLDCDDSNKDVFDAQAAFFTTPYLTSAGTSSFDYDCNGVDEKEKTTTFKCVLSAGKCVVTEGWSGSVPACGNNGTYVTACVLSPLTGTCVPNTSTKSRQACR